MSGSAEAPSEWFATASNGTLWAAGATQDASWTRSRVNALVGQFAQYESGSVATIIGETNGRTAMAVLAAQSAGSIAVLIDKRLPVPYVRSLLGTIKPAVVAHQARRVETARLATPDATPTFDFDAFLDNFDTNPDGSGETLDVAVGARSGPAMVLFSSGSSGNPKGVVQTHETIAAEAFRYHQWIEPASDTRLAIVSSLGFTSSPASIASMWRSGGSLAFYDLYRKGIGGLVAFLRASRATNVRVQTAVLRAMCDLDGLSTTHLRSVSVAGEPLFSADIQRFRTQFPSGCTLHIAYSSTETGTIGEQYVRPGEPVPETCGALRPTTGTTVHILRPSGEPVDTGEVGDILVSSTTLAAGYYDRADLTADRFVERDGQRFFRTNDCGEWVDEGHFRVAGRADHRLKIRGYNVEPNVVEEALRRYPGVTDCVVVGARRPGGGTLLAAYPVMKFTERASAGALREFLSQDMPNHLVPSIFHVVDDLPRGTTGKADRVLLARRATEDRYQLRPTDLPITARERAVHDIVAPLLGIPAIGIDDDLLDLGLDSLMLGELVLRLKADSHGPSMGSVIAEPTIRRIAASPPSTEVLSPLVPFARRSSDTHAIVMVPGAGASISYLRALALELIEIGPVFGVNAAHHRSVADVVAQAVKSIAADERIGRLPLVVAGHSWGGVVAVEITRTLLARGLRVDRLILLDTSRPPSMARPHRRTAVIRFRSALHPRTRVHQITRLLRRHSGKPDEAANPISRGQVSSYGDQIFTDQMESLRHHRVLPLAIDTIYVRTGGENRQSEVMWWESVLKDDFVTVEASGNHTSMLVEPFVRALGEDLLHAIRLGPVAVPSDAPIPDEKEND